MRVSTELIDALTEEQLSLLLPCVQFVLEGTFGDQFSDDYWNEISGEASEAIVGLFTGRTVVQV